MPQQPDPFAKWASPPQALPDPFAKWATPPSGQPVTEPAPAPVTLTSQAPQNSPWDLFKGAWSQLNPVTAVKGLVGAARDPIGTVKALGEAQGDVAEKAKASFAQGDYATGARHAAMYLLPVLGPVLDRMGDKAQAGQVWEAAGEAIGFGAGLTLPTKAAKTGVPVPNVVPKLLGTPNPAERAAMQFGMREGVPVDLATATGNPLARGLRYVADRTSITGSLVGQKAIQRQAEAMRGLSGKLAERASPAAAVPETAGATLRQEIAGQIQRLHTEANTAYDTLRTAATAHGATVDLATVKAQLAPIYEQLKPATGVTVAQGTNVASALKALERLMGGPDVIPLADADAALSSLKAIARGAAMPELRGMGRGQAAAAVNKLSAEIDATVARLGPDAQDALQAGRAATKQKYAAADVLRQFSEEPVKAFNQATLAGDAGILRLRAAEKLAPGSMRQLGRAYLDDLFETAKAEGAFNRSDALWTKWQKLGPETKKLLFPEPGLTQDLNNFFLLAKKFAENPNPSGTAYVGSLVAHGFFLRDIQTGIIYELSGAGLAAVLHSPTAAKLLTRSLKIPVSNSVAATATAAELLRAAGDHAVPMPLSSRPQ